MFNKRSKSRLNMTINRTWTLLIQLLYKGKRIASAAVCSHNKRNKKKRLMKLMRGRVSLKGRLLR